MPSCNTYRLTWVSLTLGVGYLFTAVPAKRSRCSLPWMRGYLLTAALPDLQHGIAPLGPPAPAQPRLLGRGVGQVPVNPVHVGAPAGAVVQSDAEVPHLPGDFLNIYLQ